MCLKYNKMMFSTFSRSQADRQDVSLTFTHSVVTSILRKYIGASVCIILLIMPPSIDIANGSQIHKFLIALAFFFQRCLFIVIDIITGAMKSMTNGFYKILFLVMITSSNGHKIPTWARSILSVQIEIINNTLQYATNGFCISSFNQKQNQSIWLYYHNIDVVHSANRDCPFFMVITIGG